MSYLKKRNAINFLGIRVVFWLYFFSQRYFEPLFSKSFFVFTNPILLYHDPYPPSFLLPIRRPTLNETSKNDETSKSKSTYCGQTILGTHITTQ